MANSYGFRRPMPNAPRRICRDCLKATEPGSFYGAAHQVDNQAARAQRERNQVQRTCEGGKLHAPITLSCLAASVL